MLAVYGRRMPVTWTISAADRLVSARGQGTVTLQDVEALLDDVVVKDALGYRKLFDGREAIGKYDDKDVLLLGARIQAYATLNLTGAAAIVVANQGSTTWRCASPTSPRPSGPSASSSRPRKRAPGSTPTPSSRRSPRRGHPVFGARSLATQERHSRSPTILQEAHRRRSRTTKPIARRNYYHSVPLQTLPWRRPAPTIRRQQFLGECLYCCACKPGGRRW